MQFWKVAIAAFLIGLVVLDADAQRTGQAARGSTTEDLESVDFARIRVEDLTDSQIRQVLAQAREQGLSMSEVERMAMARGLKPSEVVKLRLRLRRAQQANPASQGRSQARSQRLTDSSEEERSDEDPFSALRRPGSQRAMAGDAESDSLAESDEEEFSGFDSLTTVPEELPIFGEHLFASEYLTFEPSMDMPTPADYVLGPGDELMVNVWGASEMIYSAPVGRDGLVRIEGVGPIFVSGLSIDEARRRVIGRLSEIYSGLSARSSGGQSVFADVSLGSARTINVHILGEVEYPGSYTLPAMATVMNALYMCSGPNENGTYRRIQLIRGGAVFSELDVYAFLVDGTLTGNVQLRDQDIIKVDPYVSRVTIDGEIKRPARFEVLPGESLEDLLRFAGSFTGNAYSRRLVVRTTTETERRIVDVERASFDAYVLKSGDEVNVTELLDRYENRVEIQGAVFREGEYQLESTRTVRGLIGVAEGLRGDAFVHRAQIYRTRDDQSIEILAFDLGLLMADPTTNDIELKKDDVVLVSSTFDLREESVIEIRGSVQEQGAYPYVKGMTLKDLLVMAGGLRGEASLQRIEVSRRRTTPGAETASSVAEIFYFDADSTLSVDPGGERFTLEPFDQVFVRRSPHYIEQRNVAITGEVIYPGVFTLESKDDRISTLIQRAGGLTPEAYSRGARLVRSRGGTGAVGIDLEQVLLRPGSEFDLLVEHGDSIHVPLRLETVKVTGAVHYPISVRFSERLSFSDYVDRAGGLMDRADIKKAYVVNANGSVDRVGGGLFSRRYPIVERGAEIFVPLKPEEQQVSPQERVLILSSIVSIAAVVSTAIFQLTR